MPQVKHLVLMRLKPSSLGEPVAAIYQSLRALPDSIPGIVDFSGGPYSSPEGLNQGFTHAFVTTFADEASRDDYLVHPDHDVVKQMIIDQLDGGLDAVAAFDFLV